MNATELYKKDGTATGLFYCTQCNYVSRVRPHAEDCCQNIKCRECGVDTGGRSCLLCEACLVVDRQRKNQERIDQAEKLTPAQWTGWVCDEGGHFAESVEAWLELHGDDDLPGYLWPCQPNYFVHARIGALTSEMEGEAYEDWDPETLDGLPELQSALDKFNEANAAVCSYSPDYKQVIVLPPRAAEEAPANITSDEIPAPNSRETSSPNNP